MIDSTAFHLLSEVKHHRLVSTTVRDHVGIHGVVLLYIFIYMETWMFLCTIIADGSGCSPMLFLLLLYRVWNSVHLGFEVEVELLIQLKNENEVEYE